MNINHIFNNIKHEREDKVFWYARELSQVLEYKNNQKIHYAIRKGMIFCKKNKIDATKHFKFVVRYEGVKTKKRIVDYELSGYACYLIIKYLELKEILEISKKYFICKEMSNCAK